MACLAVDDQWAQKTKGDIADQKEETKGDIYK